MLRSYFGLSKNPFDLTRLTLLAHQQDIFDTLLVHCQQGGFCLLLGQPGTGKSTIKSVLLDHDPKRFMIAPVARTLHTYSTLLRLLCNAFQTESDGSDFKCEKRLLTQVHKLNQNGKMIVPLIDDAHLMEADSLRKLRLLFEDFPKNHNLILIGLPCLITTLNLAINEEIKSRVTFSATLPKLNPDQIQAFILGQLDLCGLAHRTFSPEALDLITRSADGFLRRTRNLCVGCLLEAVRNATKIVELPHVNRVLLQPHWRRETDFNHPQLMMHSSNTN
jgi:type II secretory pathway predicted ATPase ExeA